MIKSMQEVIKKKEKKDNLSRSVNGLWWLAQCWEEGFFPPLPHCWQYSDNIRLESLKRRQDKGKNVEQINDNIMRQTFLGLVSYTKWGLNKNSTAVV